MSTQYGIIYSADAPHDPGHTIVAPFDSPEEAREQFDVESVESADGGPWDGADIIEVSKCTSHENIDWEPGTHVETLTDVSPDDIRDAVETDWAWLLDEVEPVEAWQGTDPTEVGVFGLGDLSAVSVFGLGDLSAVGVTLRDGEMADTVREELADLARAEWQRLQDTYSTEGAA